MARAARPARRAQSGIRVEPSIRGRACGCRGERSGPGHLLPSLGAETLLPGATQGIVQHTSGLVARGSCEQRRRSRRVRGERVLRASDRLLRIVCCPSARAPRHLLTTHCWPSPRRP